MAELLLFFLAAYLMGKAWRITCLTTFSGKARAIYLLRLWRDSAAGPISTDWASSVCKITPVST